MTFIIITDDTNKRIERSIVRSAKDKSTANLREDSLEFPDILKSNLKKKAKPKPDERDQGKSNRCYPTQNTKNKHPILITKAHHITTIVTIISNRLDLTLSKNTSTDTTFAHSMLILSNSPSILTCLSSLSTIWTRFR